MVIPSGRELRSLAFSMIFNFDLISKSCFSKFIPIFVTIAFLASSKDLYFFQNIQKWLKDYLKSAIQAASSMLVTDVRDRKCR